MQLRVFAAVLCAVGLCWAQSETSPEPAPKPADSQAVKGPVVIDEEAPAGPGRATTPPTTQAKPPVAQPAGPDTPPTRRTPDANPGKPVAQSKATGKTVTGAGKAPGRGEATPYIFGPLDVVIVRVWGQPQLSGPVDIGADGNISLPLIGDVPADGLTKDQLKLELTKRLSEFLNNPEVDVQIGKVNSKTYFINGGVGHGGEFQLVKPTTILDALSGAGGFRDFTNTKKIYLLRTLPSGETRRFDFNYKDVSKGKHMEQNIYLQPGDRIFVPE